MTSGAGAHSSSFEPGHIKQIRNKAYFFLAPTRAAQRIREAVSVNVLQVAFFDGDNIAAAVGVVDHGQPSKFLLEFLKVFALCEVFHVSYLLFSEPVGLGRCAFMIL